MKTLNDFNFENKKALIRVDFNVPLNDKFEVTDATRILSAKPTIIKILEDGGSCILMSHLGRPKGVQEEFSLQHIVSKVEEIIGVEVKFASNCVGEEAEQAAANLEAGQILLLENLRFHEEEKKGDESDDDDAKEGKTTNADTVKVQCKMTAKKLIHTELG
jgi:phosphoglycerate kinase